VVKDSNECTKRFSHMCDPLYNQGNLIKEIQIIPNPNLGAFRVVVDEKLKNGMILLIDFHGKILLKKHISGLEDYIHLKPDEISAGMYLIKIFKNEFQSNRRIIIL